MLDNVLISYFFIFSFDFPYILISLLTNSNINSFKSIFVSFFSDNNKCIFLKNGLLFNFSLIVFVNFWKISKLKIFSKINFLVFKSICRQFNIIFHKFLF